MVPSYDFDIQWLIPREVEADPAIGKLLRDVGLYGNSRGNYIALFRDPQVIAMVERADPVLREFLKASGFGFIPYQSGAPEGYFPAVDESARKDVIARLVDNLERFDLKGADLGGFDVAVFFRVITRGQPMAESDTGREPAPAAARTPHVDPDLFATPTGFAKLTGRNRVMPLMVLALAATLGVYWLIQHLEGMPNGL